VPQGERRITIIITVIVGPRGSVKRVDRKEDQTGLAGRLEIWSGIALGIGLSKNM
jgi:hypothetical protein